MLMLWLKLSLAVWLVGLGLSLFFWLWDGFKRLLTPKYVAPIKRTPKHPLPVRIRNLGSVPNPGPSRPGFRAASFSPSQPRRP